MSDIRGLLHGQVERSQDRLLELYGEMTPRSWDALLDRVEQQLDEEESAQANGPESGAERNNGGGNGSGDEDDRAVTGPVRGARGALRTGPGLGLVALVLAAVAATVPSGTAPAPVPVPVPGTVLVLCTVLAALRAYGDLRRARHGIPARPDGAREPVIRFPAQPPPGTARFV